MNNVFKNYDKVQKDYQKQLRQPSGKLGKEVGKHLYNGNQEVIDKTIKEINVVNPKVIVDIGTGPGYSLQVLAKNFPDTKIIGIDPSTEMVEMAMQNNKMAVESGKVEIIKGNTPDLPLADNISDCVLLINVLYFWKNPIPHLKDIYRVLKPQGILLIYMTDKESLKRRIDETDGIYNMYERQEVVQLLQDIGFIEIKEKQIRRKINQTGFILRAIRKV